MISQSFKKKAILCEVANVYTTLYWKNKLIFTFYHFGIQLLSFVNGFKCNCLPGAAISFVGYNLECQGIASPSD